MAELHQDQRALRFELAWLPLADVVPTGPAAAERASKRLLYAAGMAAFDRSDGEFWPLVRLPAAPIEPPAVESLLSNIQSLLEGSSDFCLWRPEGPVALQIDGRSHEGGGSGLWTVEVGLDLSPLLVQLAAVPSRSDSELALFRFRTTRAELVRFGSALRSEWTAL